MRTRSLSALALAGVLTFGHAHDGKDHGAGGQAAAANQVAQAAKPEGPPDETTTRNYFTDLPVQSQDGEWRRFYTDLLKDKTVVINFVYTNCPDACPLQTAKLVQVKESIGDLFGDRVHFVSISIDPERDTPEALKKFAEQQRADVPGWSFVTGEKKNIDHIVKKLGQYSDDVDMHSTALLLGNVRTRHWVKIRPDIPTAALVHQVQSFAEEG
jgi:cytochrome oxidase Cu insertion factor (SCO1/SenC/PrrC family)